MPSFLIQLWLPIGRSSRCGQTSEFLMSHLSDQFRERIKQRTHGPAPRPLNPVRSASGIDPVEHRGGLRIVGGQPRMVQAHHHPLIARLTKRAVERRSVRDIDRADPSCTRLPEQPFGQESQRNQQPAHRNHIIRMNSIQNDIEMAQAAGLGKAWQSVGTRNIQVTQSAEAAEVKPRKMLRGIRTVHGPLSDRINHVPPPGHSCC